MVLRARYKQCLFQIYRDHMTLVRGLQISQGISTIICAYLFQEDYDVSLISEYIIHYATKAINGVFVQLHRDLCNALLARIPVSLAINRRKPEAQYRLAVAELHWAATVL